MKRLIATVFASSLLVGCVADPSSPWEITVQLERNVRLLDGRATIAVRSENVEQPEVLLNVRCADESEGRTIRVPQNTPTPELCGLTFELTELGVDDGVANSATFMVTWDAAE